MHCLLRLLTLVSTLSLVNLLPGIVETIAGGGTSHKGKKSDCNDIENSKDGLDVEARFNYPWGIAYDHNNNVVYVADCGCMDSEHKTDKLRKIDLTTGMVFTIAGSTQGYADGFGNAAHFNHIAGITLDPELEMLYIADSGNNRIRVLYIATNKVETIAGLSSPGFIDQTTISSLFNNPQSVAVYRTADAKRLLYVADTDNHAIRVIHLRGDHSGDVKTLAGGTKGFKDGYKLSAQFNHPSDIAIDGVGTYMYIADHYNHAIRRLELANGRVTTLGKDGFDDSAGGHDHILFHYPEGVMYDPDYHVLYVCEFENHDIRVVTMEGLVKTLAGEFKGKKDGVGKIARFYHPTALGFDRKNRMLYVADQYNHLVRSVSGIGSKKTFVPDVYKKKLEARKVEIIQLFPPPSSPWLFLTACGIAVVLLTVLIVRPGIRFMYNKINGHSPQTTFR